MADNNAPVQPQPSRPDPALKRLEPLVGTWRITGRTLDSKEDNISGTVTIEWLPGMSFLQQRGEMQFMGATIQSLEIVGYDPSTNAFPSHVYSNMGEMAAAYHWDVQGTRVTHWNEGSKYTGTFNADGSILSGGWRPLAGKEGPDNLGYDATMVKVSTGT